MYYNVKNKNTFSIFRAEESLNKFLTILASGINIKTEKVLVLGGILGKELERLFNLFPKSKFFVTDKSKTILNSINESYESFENFDTYVVDAFDGSSLLDFRLRHGKFGLVIVCRLDTYTPNNVRLLHFYRFIYNHFLKKNGIFCIIINELKIWEINHSILRKKKPFINEVINIKNKENPVHVIFYNKKRNWIH
jgi:hypothetical protein